MSLPQVAEANISFVTPRVAVGGDLDLYDRSRVADQVTEIVEAGITHVIDVRVEWSDEQIWAEQPQVDYFWSGIDDAGQTVPPEWFESVVERATAALADPRAKVLTHCHMGINRGPSAGFAVLLAQGWDPIDALSAIRAARPIAYIAYAEDALRWHHLTRGYSGEQRRADFKRVNAWRRANKLDVVNAIRMVRRSEEQRRVP